MFLSLQNYFKYQLNNFVKAETLNLTFSSRIKGSVNETSSDPQFID